MRKKNTCFLLTILSFVLLLTFSYPKAVHAESVSECNIYALYLGSEDKGDSTLLESQGHYLLVDIGSAGNTPAIISQLTSLGITHVDIMFSHLHIDHTGGTSGDYLSGLHQLAQSGIIVDTLYLPDRSLIPMSPGYPLRYEKFESFMAEQECGQIVYLNVGDRFQFGDVTADIIGPLNTASDQLYPDMFTEIPEEKDRRTLYENNCSLVTIFTCGNTRYFTAGDIYEYEANALVSQYGDTLRCDIMKLCHHGLGGGNSTALLKAIHPSYSFIPNTGSAQKSDISGKWRYYSALKKASKYGMCYSVGNEKKTLIYHIENDNITLYQGSSIKPANKLQGWQNLYGADGVNRDHDMYYLDKNCKPLKGVRKIDDHYYYFRSGGQMDYGTYDESGNYSGWKLYGTNERYFTLSANKEYAYMKYGISQVDDNTYYFDKNGYKVVPDASSQNGITPILTNIGSDTIAVNTDGALYLNTWETIDDTTYYFGTDGKMYKNGVHKIGNNHYLFESDGELVMGEYGVEFCDFKDNTYAINTDGSLICDQSAVIDGTTYYFNSTGAMQTDKIIKLNQSKYYFNSDGEMVKNKLIKTNGCKYYVNGEGKIVCSKFIKVNDYKYYCNKDGQILCNKMLKKNGYKYYFNSSGKMVRDKLVKVNGYKYYFNKSGKMVCKKIVTIKGNKFYFGSNGRMVCNKTITVNGHKYQCHKNGVLTKSASSKKSPANR